MRATDRRAWRPHRGGALNVALATACVGLLSLPPLALAGPPFATDDPEPVPTQAWEFYLASANARDPSGWTGTAPHLEANYGPFTNAQLHVIVPFAYAVLSTGAHSYGLGDIELGVKYRFVHEREWTPQVGSFPLLELPTGDSGRGLGGGHPRAFLPLWLQKSWGRWTSYGGGGYWINPGAGNRNWVYVGALVQCQVLESLAIGAELFHMTPAEADGGSEARINAGAILDVGDGVHILASAGRGLQGPNQLQGYLALLVTFGGPPPAPGAPRE